MLGETSILPVCYPGKKMWSGFLKALSFTWFVSSFPPSELANSSDAPQEEEQPPLLPVDLRPALFQFATCSTDEFTTCVYVDGALLKLAYGMGFVGGVYAVAVVAGFSCDRVQLRWAKNAGKQALKLSLSLLVTAAALDYLQEVRVSGVYPPVAAWISSEGSFFSGVATESFHTTACFVQDALVAALVGFPWLFDPEVQTFVILAVAVVFPVGAVNGLAAAWLLRKTTPREASLGPPPSKPTRKPKSPKLDFSPTFPAPCEEESKQTQ